MAGDVPSRRGSGSRPVPQVDVVVLGGGLAGLLLARHLRLVRPEVSVVLLEAATVVDRYKVGESTAEVAAAYLVRQLGLSSYLYQHQLPKNGLRLFFDSPDRDLSLSEMSELGSDSLPYYSTFQINRATFERDLVDMERAHGVRVELGATVVDLAIDGRQGHLVTFDQDGRREQLRARWLCDASGRRQLVPRRLQLPVHKESRLRTGAAWARYTGVLDMDQLPDAAWRSRVRYTPRYLSTNHFMHDGYWIWFIPLAGDVMSVGAVYDRDRLPAGPRTRTQFEEFLRSHRSCRELLAGARMEDFQAYARLPYYCDTYYSTERWTLTGESGAFADPLYSPGSDFIAMANEFTVSLICADLDGSADLSEMVAAYNAYHAYRYESVIRLYAGTYQLFGSFEVFRLKYLLDVNNYFTNVAWPFLDGRTTDLAWLSEEVGRAPRVLQAISTMQRELVGLAERLRARGEYHAQNRGRWASTLDGIAHLLPTISGTMDAAVRRAEVDQLFASVFARVLERTVDAPGLSGRERVLQQLGIAQVLAHGRADDETYRRLLRRAAGGIERELHREFPAARFGTVLLEPGQVQVSGLDGRTPESEGLVVRAQELWDRPGGLHLRAAARSS